MVLKKCSQLINLIKDYMFTLKGQLGEEDNELFSLLFSMQHVIIKAMCVKVYK